MKINDVTILDSDQDRARRLASLLAAADLSAAILDLDDGDPDSSVNDTTPQRAHCYMVSIAVPISRSVDAIEQLRTRGEPITVVAYGAHPTVEGVVALMRAGAFDVITRTDDSHALLTALRASIARDARILPERVRVRAAMARVDTLSRRERQVLACVLSGYSNRGMGEALGVSVKTIEAHRANLMRKAGCKTVAELVRIASDAGFDQSPPGPTARAIAG